MKNVLSSVVLGAALCAITASVSAQVSTRVTDSPGVTGKFSLGVGADYSTGKYGRNESTNIFYLPVIGRYEYDRWLFKVTLPYVRISGPVSAVAVDGRPVDPGTSTERRTESGIGDVVGAATYTAILQEKFFLDVTGKLKLPTADDSKGLGTGKTDYSIQTDAYQVFGQLTGFAGIGYRWYGDPAGIDLKNAFFGSIGASYKVSPEVSFGASLDYRQSILSGRDALIELAPFVSWKIQKDTKVQFYVVRGFTDSSVDFGAGALLFQSF